MPKPKQTRKAAPKTLVQVHDSEDEIMKSDEDLFEKSLDSEIEQPKRVTKKPTVMDSDSDDDFLNDIKEKKLTRTQKKVPINLIDSDEDFSLDDSSDSDFDLPKRASAEKRKQKKADNGLPSKKTKMNKKS